MKPLVEKAVAALLEAWAKRTGLGNDFKTLKNQLLELSALLTSACGLPTDNSSLEDLALELQQLVNKAENLIDELDYYRLEDQIQQTGHCYKWTSNDTVLELKDACKLQLRKQILLQCKINYSSSSMNVNS